MDARCCLSSTIKHSLRDLQFLEYTREQASLKMIRSQHVLILLLGLLCASQVLGKHLTKAQAKVLHMSHSKRGLCDPPTGVCTFINDPCPPGLRRCPQYDDECPVATNHCCCNEPEPAKCEPPTGMCTYVDDPCPPDTERCPEYDEGCKVETNHCCCNI
ncbi:uncharacterized protein LOC114955386 isoform X2 [Acropora millepora]|uniref:uncharacterized protein LOC114955386 isoform X2 n=1 Tax=Acropora millepora TaxID=45264 RepID=UPI001CF0E706|nr:uncharacterized protein LOC114955386 isoform X2 [Acropora millepora]